MFRSGAGICNCGRDAALIELARPTLDQLINTAAEKLPEDWEINIEVQQGYGEVIVTRPNGDQVHMHEDDTTLTQQFANALRLIHDELEADKL